MTILEMKNFCFLFLCSLKYTPFLGFFGKVQKYSIYLKWNFVKVM